jgi:hypothetical protein
MATELVTLQAEKCDDARFAVCYGRGSSFRQEGKFHRVEKGARTLVHRSLCVLNYFGRRCEICPNSKVKVKLEVIE